ncbi:Zeta toxin, putative [Trypanosoma equiperdum]|uniref:Zeta toxin, putative n=1 Tax=Trypanosoma equiperdum TaxID=5694 RepID=A0A1G4I1D5_TRYEQ|nr:Zeta toxin, putative [Trypanosoma equiperdum]
MQPPSPTVSFIEYVLLALELPPNMFVSKLAACCTMLFLTRSDPKLLRELCRKWVIRFKKDRHLIISRIRESTRSANCSDMYSRASMDSVVENLPGSDECDPQNCMEHFLHLINTFVPEYFSWNWHHTELMIQTNRKSEDFVRERLLPLCRNSSEDADGLDDEDKDKDEALASFLLSKRPADTRGFNKCEEAWTNGLENPERPPLERYASRIRFATFSNLRNCFRQSPHGVVLIFHANYSSKSCETLRTFEEILMKQMLNPQPQVCVVHIVAEPELARLYQINWFPTIIYVPPLSQPKSGPLLEVVESNTNGNGCSFNQVRTSNGTPTIRGTGGEADDVSCDALPPVRLVSSDAEESSDDSPCAASPLQEEEISPSVKHKKHRVYPPEGDLSAPSLAKWINSRGSVAQLMPADNRAVSRINQLPERKGFPNGLKHSSSRDSLQTLSSSAEAADSHETSAKAPVFIFLGGGVAAGKSTVVSVLSGSLWWEEHKANSVIISADNYKSQSYLVSNDMEKQHEYSTRLAEELMVRAVNGRRSIVFDSTMMWKPFVQQVIDMVRNSHRVLYEQGPGYRDGGKVEEYFRTVGPRSESHLPPYVIRLLAITVEPEVAVRRGILRNFSTGRSVPIKTQLRSFRLFAENFVEYVSLVDEATLYNNNVIVDLEKGELPPVVAEKREGKLVVVDHDAYALFLGQRGLNENAGNALELYNPKQS